MVIRLPIIIVDPVFIQDERIAERANLKEAMPVSGISCEARDLQTEDDAGAPHPDLRHQLLRSFAISGRSA